MGIVARKGTVCSYGFAEFSIGVEAHNIGWVSFCKPVRRRLNVTYLYGLYNVMIGGLRSR